jgi:hypothetical protein
MSPCDCRDTKERTEGRGLTRFLCSCTNAIRRISDNAVKEILHDRKLAVAARREGRLRGEYRSKRWMSILIICGAGSWYLLPHKSVKRRVRLKFQTESFQRCFVGWLLQISSFSWCSSRSSLRVRLSFEMRVVSETDVSSDEEGEETSWSSSPWTPACMFPFSTLMSISKPIERPPK